MTVYLIPNVPYYIAQLAMHDTKHTNKMIKRAKQKKTAFLLALVPKYMKKNAL